MSVCERIDVCGFFTNNMIRIATTKERFEYKLKYCMKDKTKCARYMVIARLFAGYSPESEETMEKIDRQMKSMFPGDVALAKDIIRQLSA